MKLLRIPFYLYIISFSLHSMENSSNELAQLQQTDEYIQYNENLIAKCIACTSEQAKTPEFKELFNHPLADFNYCRRKKIPGTPLFYICQNILHIVCTKVRRPECVSYLLEKKANANCLSVDKRTPIGCVINAFNDPTPFYGDSKRCIDFIDILLYHNADIHHISPLYNSNYLHLAAACDYSHLLLPYFTEKGVDVNCFSTSGHTPLLSLIYTQNYRDAGIEHYKYDTKSFLRSVHILIEAKADITIANHDGRSVFSFLSNRYRKDVSEILLNISREQGNTIKKT